MSRIARTTSGGTRPSSAATRMATRNTTIVPRYGRANAQTRRSVAPRQRRALDGLGVPRHQPVVAHPHAIEATKRRPSARSLPYHAPACVQTTPARGVAARRARRSPSASRASAQRRRHRRAPTRRRRRRRPTDRRRRHRPTGTDGTERADRRDATTDARPTTDGRRSEPAPIEWTASRRAARGRPRSRCPSTTTTRRRRRSSCTSPATSPTTRTNRSARCSSTPAAPASAAPTFAEQRRVHLRRGAARPLRHRRLGPPRHRATSEPAIDCIDDYDEYFAGTDITPDDDAERQQIIDLAEDFADAVRREATPTSSSTSAPTTPPATWTRSAGRSARTRSATSGSATAASSARTWATLFPDTVRAAVLDGAADPNADALRGQHAAGGGLRGHADDVPRRSAAPTTSARSTTTATPRARSTR